MHKGAPTRGQHQQCSSSSVSSHHPHWGPLVSDTQDEYLQSFTKEKGTRNPVFK